ncbi:hypothetical protein GO730_10600 [Spirosoma sp. HMF3257]|uniref:hypothetical protein n=1 Tax=Spirosoma telluris TaxID=2183553 RepID=UPI0011B938B9|nr:hypothetical protein [Spirosoma telluris]
MKPLSISLLLLFSAPVLGQTFTVTQIDSIVHRIDSTKGLRNAVVDGYLKRKGNKKLKGGFSDTFWLTPTDNHLVKVERGEALNHYAVRAYYFYNDTLIFVKTSIYESQLARNRISEGEYYFYADVLLKKREKGEQAIKSEVFIKQSQEYLVDAKSIFNL